MTLTKAINEVKQSLMEENIEEDRKAGKYKKGEMIEEKYSDFGIGFYEVT